MNMAARAPNINRSRVYEDIVQRLAAQALPGTDRRLFPTIRELLCFAAVLGYSENRKVPLDKTQGVEDISYQQFERGDAENLIYLIALADSQNVDVIREDNEDECARIFEEYANGGLGLIKDYLLRDGGEYPDRALTRLLHERGYLKAVQGEPDTGAISF
ncbi:DNA phosphorothioation-associated protein 4 [Mesorhizobium sp. YC-39]|uniref:DNA phosphorothioation-associated protein 4 n=1 Tax=unclassified Mesorhizobium TaxID=325217 RepID=UPI0021E9783F|nr:MULTISPECIES: DNA phosphorothioation-associated protein 4 [unclassified Mesorhizobium]MCV3211098.1 DNA phosphorothioation-associated protein 4 [Mesorhizobium sp. YC-2]MCV3232823.1 DNA phosphorothioation-associated protein 4 [Mesorhizobium sp. YC-39]